MYLVHTARGTARQSSVGRATININIILLLYVMKSPASNRPANSGSLPRLCCYSGVKYQSMRFSSTGESKSVANPVIDGTALHCTRTYNIIYILYI